ncbi:type II toxin-antitoxin system VapC family toxin [Deinococcus petrolearius]|uniref:Type II toxin-antitoxin system VapC family toxin n=1 Tax=Deinococcus petrolearius TaxID=1751295 RepID=A0ABW1DIL6_9DEIO
MYLLDTNVVSELRKVRSGKADPQVSRWAQGVQASALYLSVITVQELELGILLKERRDPEQGRVLRGWFEGQVLPAFAGRLLPVTVAIARQCAALNVPETKPERDGLIAATALVHGLTVATRNVRDFQGTGVPLLNPWQTLPAG